MVRTVFSLLVMSLVLPVRAGDFQTLSHRVPSGANVVMAVDVAGTLSSPIATQNGWGKTSSTATGKSPLYLPPEADKVLVASQVDLVRGLGRSWDVALISLTEPIPLRLLAKAEGGQLDQISGMDVAWIPSDAYVLEPDANTIVMQAPANRQAIARWIEQKGKGQAASELSDYLTSAVGLTGSGAHIVIAIDAAGAVQPHRVREQLGESEIVASNKLDVAKTAALVAGLQGIVIQVKFTDKATGTVQIDFSEAVTMKPEVAKSLVLAALNNRQMALPGIDSWTCSVSGKSITLTGEASQDALRRLLSLMEPPSTKFSSLKDADVEKAPTSDDTAKRSQEYWNSVQTLLADLRQKSGSFTSDSYWIDRYAAKIDKLPILHVDDELLEYGQKVSETLRVMSGSRKSTNLQGGAVSRRLCHQAEYTMIQDMVTAVTATQHQRLENAKLVWRV